MRFVKGNRASVDRLHKDTNVAALQAMAWLKRLLGQRVDVESPTCLALVPTGMGEPPVFKPDGTKYTIMEITPDLVRRHVYRHRNGGLQSDERYYKKGTPKYKHEERVARAVIGWVRELQAAQAGGLYEIRGCSFGQGLIGLRHGSLGDTVCKADGTPLRPMYSRTRSVGREIVCGGKRTQSQVDVHGHGLHQGRTVHLLLCGIALCFCGRRRRRGGRRRPADQQTRHMYVWQDKYTPGTYSCTARRFLEHTEDLALCVEVPCVCFCI